MRSSSARAESDIPTRHYAAAPPTDHSSAPHDAADLDGCGAHVALPAVLVAPAEHDQPRPRGGADRDGRDGADPVARVAHGGQLPALELVDRHLGQAPERHLEAVAEIVGGLAGGARPPGDVPEDFSPCPVAPP